MQDIQIDSCIKTQRLTARSLSNKSGTVWIEGKKNKVQRKPQRVNKD